MDTDFTSAPTDREGDDGGECANPDMVDAAMVTIPESSRLIVATRVGSRAASE